VRRTVAKGDSGTESSGYIDDSPAWPSTDQPAPAAKAPWSGSGGRWIVWPMRIVLWAALLIVIYRGVMAIALNETPASTSASNGAAATATSGTATQFPVTLAEAYVMQFGRVYFNFSPATAAQRQAALAAFVMPGLLQGQQQLGFNNSPTSTLQSEDLAGIDVRSPNSAVVTLLAMLNGRLMEFGVPVYAAGGGMEVSGLPALLATPPMVQLPASQQSQPDAAAMNALQQQLPLFFTAYASGNGAELNRYVMTGAAVAGLPGGDVTFGSIAGLYVPPGGATRQITVTVNWQLVGQPGGFATTYDMSVTEQQGGKWYVGDIRASTQPMGTAP
jgi:Conjugative transposon protein TcpC